jgi:glycosyltransferase involved in cell wall biosynthesis
MESDSEMRVLPGDRAKTGTARIGADRRDSQSEVAPQTGRLFLSVVVPVYKEEGNVPEFITRMTGILAALTASYEIIFALDPSPDKTEEVILDARAENSRIKLLKFSRRFGQPMATLAGLQYSSGEAVIVMDVDLQDPPELVVAMVEKWKEGYDVVYAQRKNRNGESWIKKVVSGVGYRVINKIAEVNIPPNTGDFRLMSRRVVTEINRLKECHGFLRGMVALVGFKQTSILFDRPQRFAGKGNYNRFLGSLRIGFNGIFCFSNYALTLSTQLGFIIAIGAFLVGFVYAVLKIAGAPFPLGNPTIVILVLFLGGIQLVGIGILGEYIGRIYEEVKGRPRFIMESTHGFDVTRDSTLEQDLGVTLSEDEAMRATKSQKPVQLP